MAAVSVEGADSDGDQTEEMLRGDAVVVEQRRLQAVRGSRARAAVQAELDKLRLLRRRHLLQRRRCRRSGRR